MNEQTKKKLFFRSDSEVQDRKKDNLKHLSRVKSLLIQNAKHLQLKSRPDTLGAIEDLIQCKICKEKLYQPRMLPCQHTFCIVCLHKIVKKNEDSMYIRCPICFKDVMLENGPKSVDSLPRNLYIDSLLNVVVSPPTTPVAAAPEVRCIKCETVLEIEQSCLHCLHTFCKICWGEHLKEIEEKLPSLLSQIDESEKRLDYKLNMFNEHCEQLKDTIKKAAENKIENIRSSEKKILNEIDSIKKTETQSLEVIKTNLADIKKQIDEAKLDNFRDQTQQVKTFLALHTYTSKVLDDVFNWGLTQITFDSESFDLREDHDVTYNEINVNDVKSFYRRSHDHLDSIETRTMYYKCSTFNPKLVWNKCPRPSGLAVSPWNPTHIYIATADNHSVLIMDKAQMKPIGRIEDPNMICPVGIAISSDKNEIYVTDKWSHSIHVFSNENIYLRKLCSKGSGNRGLRNPEGIAISGNNQLLVCDTGNDRVVVLNPEDGKQIDVIGASEKTTQLNMPTGIVLYQDQIIIADSGNHRIKIFNRKGEKVREIGSLGKNLGQFKNVEAVAVDPLGFILAGDAGNGRIQIFKPDGSLVRSFGSTKHEKFTWVSGIAFTPELDIIVTDNKGRCLFMY